MSMVRQDDEFVASASTSEHRQKAEGRQVFSTEFKRDMVQRIQRPVPNTSTWASRALRFGEILRTRMHIRLSFDREILNTILSLMLKRHASREGAEARNGG